MPTTTAKIISVEYQEASDRFQAEIEVIIPEGDDYVEPSLDKIGDSIFCITYTRENVPISRKLASKKYS